MLRLAFGTVRDADGKPWDARLVDWMSRGSDRAPQGGRRRMTPRQMLASSCVWAVFAIVTAMSSHPRGWWLWAVYAALCAAVAVLQSWRKRKGKLSESRSEDGITRLDG